MTIEEHISLAPLTTFRIGGPARFFARAKTVDELREFLDFAREKALTVFILGGGSNILIPDEGFVGLVIKIELSGIELKEEDDETILVAEGGERWDSLVGYAIDKKLWGIENLSGIPGTVGGAAVQNIGAYGAEIKDTLLWLEACDRESGEVRRFTNQECNFSYRTSLFKKDRGSRYIILRVALRLSKQESPNLSYRDVHKVFDSNATPDIAEIRDAILTIRSKKFPNLAYEGTAGSFFLNPVVSREKAVELSALFPDMPQFPADEGSKISLAYLLDKGLHMRGARMGGARLFEHQPLVLVAQFGTPAQDVRELAALVHQKIQENYGIDIEPEVLMH